MAVIEITTLTEETTPDNAADFLILHDVSGGDLNKVKPSNILGTDLSAVRALTPSNDDFLQRKAGAWANRTIAQVKTDLGLAGTNSGDQDLSAYATKTGAETLTNKTLTSPVINSPTGIVKSDVGLGNVDNTSNATERAAAATLTNKTVALGSNSLSGTIAQFNTACTDADFAQLEILQNSQSAAYTLVLADSGKHILHPSADTTARTFTIPANSSVAFPVGTAITFINQNAGGVITIAITTDTMRLAGAGTTGSRTLAANGIATAVKVTSTEWIISGIGLT